MAQGIKQNVKGAFTIRFLRIGDDVYITREVYKMDDGVRKGASLFQAIDTVSGTLSVDWTDPNEQPICEFKASSSAGYPVSIMQAAFSYDGVEVKFGAVGETGWATSTNGKFEMKQEEGRIFFKIVDNIASPTQVSNKQIGYSLTYISNGVINSYSGSMDVVIQQAGSDSHVLQILSPFISFDDKTPTEITLTLQATYGVKPITIGKDGYTAKWWKDGVELDNTGKDILVIRSDVYGASRYVAKLLLNGTPVAIDGIYISDTLDEYQVQSKQTVPFVNETTNGSVKLYLTKNGGEVETQDDEWSWEVLNSMGVLTKQGTGKQVTITADDCKNVPIGGGAEYYSDANYMGIIEVTL